MENEYIDENEIILEALNEELTLPINPLSEEEVRKICEDIYNGKKGIFVRLGAFKYLPLAANYANGKLNKSTGEFYPVVRAIACYESQVRTGIDYNNTKYAKWLHATDAYKLRHPEEAPPEEVKAKGISEWVFPHVLGYTSRGNLAFVYYKTSQNRPKVRYYISTDGEDFKESNKEEIAQYMTPGGATKFLAPYEGVQVDTETGEVSEESKYRLALAGQIYHMQTSGETLMMRPPKASKVGQKVSDASEVESDVENPDDKFDWE